MPQTARFLAALAFLATPALAHAQALPGEQPLPPERLAELRAGFQLPGGITVTIGVTTATRIDGREVLRSTLNIRDGLPNVGVLAGDPSGKGLSQVEAKVDGSSVTTRDGMVQLRSAADGLRVDLAGDSIAISHLVGRALGSVVTNTANDRSIDVETSIDIGLGGIRPDAIGSSAVRASNLALDATTRLVR